MTTSLTRAYALIGLENLNAKGMLANHPLAQAVSDTSFFEVKRQLLYKTETAGEYVQLVDRWNASSKTCHQRGWVKQAPSLQEILAEAQAQSENVILGKIMAAKNGVIRPINRGIQARSLWC